MTLSEKDLRSGIAVVIPALSPGEFFVSYVETILSKGFNRVIIVNDGSPKRFDDVFKTLQGLEGVQILQHKRNLGQGASLKNAFRLLLEEREKVQGVVTADADGQHSIEDVVRIANSLTLSDSEAEVVIGSRALQSSDIPWKSRVGNSITSSVVKALFGKYLVDTQTGLRCFPASLLPTLVKIPGNRFEYNMNVLLSVMGSGININSVPIQTIYHDSSNSVSHFRPVIDSLRIYLIIFKQFFKFASSSLVSAAVDLTLFVLAIELLFQGSPDPLSVITSVALARAGSTLVNFAVNRKLVFGNREQKRKTLIRYYTLVSLNLSASALGSAYLTQVLDGRVVWAKIIVDTSLFAFSYLTQRHWVFSPTRKG